MKLLIDMNLSPDWVKELQSQGWQDVMPKHLGPLLASILSQHQSVLEKGALLIVDEAKARVRLLPL